jgi:hypothetical protein
MPLPTFAKKEDIPEAVRDGYVEREGKWVPDDSTERGLKESQRKLLDEKKAAADELARIRGVLGDRSLDDVDKLIKSQRETEEERQRKAGEFDKILEKRVNETKVEYEKRIAELTPYKTRFTDLTLDLAIREAAEKAGVLSGDMKAVLKIVKGDRVRLDEKTGKPVVVDSDGDVTSATVEKFFVETFKTEYPKFYTAAGGSGGGAGGGTGGGGGRGPANGGVDIRDQASFLANVSKIAKGEVAAGAA